MCVDGKETEIVRFVVRYVVRWSILGMTNLACCTEEPHCEERNNKTIPDYHFTRRSLMIEPKYHDNTISEIQSSFTRAKIFHELMSVGDRKRLLQPYFLTI